jgi:hypothetical protein
MQHGCNILWQPPPSPGLIHRFNSGMGDPIRPALAEAQAALARYIEPPRPAEADTINACSTLAIALELTRRPACAPVQR